MRGSCLFPAGRVSARSELAAWQRLAATTEELNNTNLDAVLAAAVVNAAKLFSAEQAEVFLRGAPSDYDGWEELGAEGPHELTFTRVPFAHPLWVLYSSGTTGLPKAIVQSQGGILLEHLKKMRLHIGLGPGADLDAVAPIGPFRGHPGQCGGVVHPQPGLLAACDQVARDSPADPQVAMVVDDAAEDVPEHGLILPGQSQAKIPRHVEPDPVQHRTRRAAAV